MSLLTAVACSLFSAIFGALALVAQIPTILLSLEHRWSSSRAVSSALTQVKNIDRKGLPRLAAFQNDPSFPETVRREIPRLSAATKVCTLKLMFIQQQDLDQDWLTPWPKRDEAIADAMKIVQWVKEDLYRMENIVCKWCCDKIAGGGQE